MRYLFLTLLLAGSSFVFGMDQYVSDSTQKQPEATLTTFFRLNGELQKGTATDPDFGLYEILLSKLLDLVPEEVSLLGFEVDRPATHTGAVKGFIRLTLAGVGFYDERTLVERMRTDEDQDLLAAAIKDQQDLLYLVDGRQFSTSEELTLSIVRGNNKDLRTVLKAHPHLKGLAKLEITPLESGTKG